MLKKINTFQHEKRNLVSPSSHVMFCYYINTKEIPKHFTIFFCRLFRDYLNKGAIYYVAIAMVILSFHVKKKPVIFVFMQKLTWYFVGVYLRNRKHFPCFYRVIETRVEVWENEKCRGNTSHTQVFPQLFLSSPKLSWVFLELDRNTKKVFSISFRV